MTGLERFTQQYCATALWSSSDGEPPEPLDKVVREWGTEQLERMQADAASFYYANHLLWQAGEADSDAGHDFWLTRNGHGAGFWDGDWPDPLGEYLTRAAERYRTCDLYVGDDNLLYLS